jgi:hypothetical protein
MTSALLWRFKTAQDRHNRNDMQMSIQDGGSIEIIAVAYFMLASKFVGSSMLWIHDNLDVVRLSCSSAEIESAEGTVF